MEEVSFSVLENVSRFLRLEIAVRKSLAFRAAGLLSRPARMVLKDLASEDELTFLEVYAITLEYDTSFVDEVLSLAGAMGLLTINYTDELVEFNPEFLRQTDSWGPSSNVAVTRWTHRLTVSNS